MTSTQDDAARTRPASRRWILGAGVGVVATLVMSAVMLTGVATGISPMPKPIPAALVSTLLGALPKPGLMALAAVAHLSYGAVAGALLAGLSRRITVPLALGYGAVLWAFLGLAWLPYLGWGFFGTGITPKIAVTTLLLHLLYGLVLGLLLDRSSERGTAPSRA